jgi:hypothetical protein
MRYLALLALLGLVGVADARVSVRGYSKKDGSYVAPHQRTNPNHTQRDNWSSKPNVNPNTGKPGTHTPAR